MRTTVNLEPDVASAIDRIRKERGLGLSHALNELARRGLSVKQPSRLFRQRSAHVGLRIDVRNVAEALEQLEGPTAR